MISGYFKPTPNSTTLTDVILQFYAKSQEERSAATKPSPENSSAPVPASST